MEILLTALVAVLGYVARLMLRLDKTVQRLDQHLFGATGDNGLTATVRALEERVHETERRADRHDTEIAVLQAE